VSENDIQQREKLAKRRYYILLAIFLSALVIRLVYIAEHNARSPFSEAVFIDAFTYHDSALEILGKMPPREFTHTAYYQPPLYPYFLALVYKVFSVSFTSVRVLQAILGALSCVLIFVITERYFSFKAAVLAGFAAVFYRSFILFTGEILTPTLGMFLGLMGFYAASIALEKDTQPAKKHFLLASVSGLSLGLMAITIPNILLFAFFLLGYIILEKRFRKRFILLAFFAVPFTVPIGITAVRNYTVSKDVILISYNSGLNFYIGNNLESEKTVGYRAGSDEWMNLIYMPTGKAGQRGMPRSEWSGYYYRKGFSYIFSHPLHYAGAQARKAVRFFSHIEFRRSVDIYYLISFSTLLSYDFVTYWLVCPLAVLGMIVFFKNWRELLLLYVFFLLYFLSVTGFFVAGRYRIPVIPVMIVFASSAVFELIAAVSYRKKLLIYLGVLAVLFVFVSVDWFGDHVPPETNAENSAFAGMAYLKTGKHKEAQRFYAAALEIDPGNADAHQGLGRCMIMLGRLQEAREQFRKVIELRPASFLPHVALAELSEQQKDYRGAVKHLQDAVKTGRMNNEAWAETLQSLGRNHFNLGEFDKAEASLKNALLIYPRNAEILTNLGSLYGTAGRFEEAAAAFEAAISNSPGYEKAYNDLLLAHIIQKDAGAVRDLLNRAKRNGISLNSHLLQESGRLLRGK
jgi:tetratricopeptide (TPR) repeat protein